MEDEEKKFPLPFEHPDFYDWEVPITYDNDKDLFYMQMVVLGHWKPLIDGSLEKWESNGSFDLKDPENIQASKHFFAKVLEFIKTKDFEPYFEYAYYSHLACVWSGYTIHFDINSVKGMEPDGVVVYETSDWTRVCLVYKTHSYQFRKLWQDYLAQHADGDIVKGTLNQYGRYESDEPFPMDTQEFKQHTESFCDGWRFMCHNGYKWLAQGKPYHDSWDYWYWPISYLKEMVQ